MEYPTAPTERTPGRAAVIDERTGRTLTYGALEERSRAVAHRLWDAGLRPGDHVALAVANRCEFYEFCWAAHRIGLYYTAVNTHLTADEARHRRITFTGVLPRTETGKLAKRTLRETYGA